MCLFRVVTVDIANTTERNNTLNFRLSLNNAFMLITARVIAGAATKNFGGPDLVLGKTLLHQIIWQSCCRKNNKKENKTDFYLQANSIIIRNSLIML